MDVHGKIALVTGGASGIGAAICDALASAGATVLVTDIQEGMGRHRTEALAGKGGEADFFVLDVTDPVAVSTLADRVHQRFGGLDILVNAAGWERVEPFMENDTEFWTRIVALNLMGPVHVSRAFLPLLMEVGGGAIVNLASDTGRVGSSGETMYAGANGGLIAFTKSLAREMTRARIRVNCVCAGPTDTPMFASLPEAVRESLIQAIPMGRLAKPSEVADAVLFFASSRSSYCTGQVLSVSGGLTMVD